VADCSIYLTTAPIVTLPKRPASKERWLTRDEAARLLRAVRAEPKARHLTRLILIAIYTGTRKDAILRL
jgi:integrase